MEKNKINYSFSAQNNHSKDFEPSHLLLIQKHFCGFVFISSNHLKTVMSHFSEIVQQIVLIFFLSSKSCEF